MAAASPALNNNGTDNTLSAGATAFNINPPPPSATASKNLRGLNKPKCIKCGNVARSRCPFHSCKSCCSKAQNPCEIHVLKAGSNVLDKTTSNSAKVDQQPTDASHSGSSHRIASLRQLSNTFAQFNNLSTPVRSRKPLSRKDAQTINEWRFLKLKEFRDRNIEAENEAFDRYMSNVGLLEEVFCVNSSPDGQTGEGLSAVNSDDSVDDSDEMKITALKLKLRSNPVRIENFRKRVQRVVDEGLAELSKSEFTNGNAAGANDTTDEIGNKPKKSKSGRAERASVRSELMEKLNKARNLDDLKGCQMLKSQLKRNQVDSDTAGKSSQNCENDPLDIPNISYSPPKWFSTSTVDQESLSQINAQFCSLEEIEDL